MRLESLRVRGQNLDERRVKTALLAHLCRCTGWRTILDAARRVGPSTSADTSRDLEKASQRATLEGGVPQKVGPFVALGGGGFADDTAPDTSLVAVPDGRGGFSVGETVTEARARARKVQGRNTTLSVRHPLEIPPGTWALTLSTTFVEPAYLEPDASWCSPGGSPADPLANGGAFGGKVSSDAPGVARRLADEHHRAVRVLYSREDVVRSGPKRPPIAAGLREDASGLVRVARTRGSDLRRWATSIKSVLPGVEIEEVVVAGPRVADSVRAAGWAEASVLLAVTEALRSGNATPGGPVSVASPEGARATASCARDGDVAVSVAAGDVLDEVVLRSYIIGAAHQALGWVLREAVAVDAEGEVLDLTVRSFGIIPARDMPEVTVSLEATQGPPVRAGDCVFAAVAAAAWITNGLAPAWPLGSRSSHSRVGAS
jgi:xanthine dehydrogenase small subunit